MKSRWFSLIILSTFLTGCSSNVIEQPDSSSSIEFDLSKVPEVMVPSEELPFEFSKNQPRLYGLGLYGNKLANNWAVFYENAAFRKLSLGCYYSEGIADERSFYGGWTYFYQANPHGEPNGTLFVDYYEDNYLWTIDRHVYLGFQGVNKTGCVDKREYFFGVCLLESGFIVTFDFIVFYPDPVKDPLIFNGVISDYWLFEKIIGYSFPKINGAYQDITFKQTKYLFDALLNEYKGKYYTPKY